MSKTVEVLEIIASELHLPTDWSLSEILAAIYCVDVDGEIMKLFIKIGSDEIIEKIKSDFADKGITTLRDELVAS